MLIDIGPHHNFNNQFKNSSQYISSLNSVNKQSMQASTSAIIVTHPTNIAEKAKRHYNSEVDPARYRKVIEEGITKFACSICGNTYKWRKSLNKHWKEKHITETPPPLDAPVTVKLRNGTTTINCIATNGTTLTIPSTQQMIKNSDSFTNNNNNNNNNNNFDKKTILKPNDINQKAINSTSTPINNKNSISLINRSMNNSNLKQSSHSTSLISSNNNSNNLPTVVPPSNNVFAYFNALQQYINNAAMANNISFNAPSNSNNNNHESKVNKNNNLNGSTELNTINSNKRQRKLDDSIERPLDLSMKNNISHIHIRRRSSSNDSNNDYNNNNQQSSISLKNLENSIKRLKTLNNSINDAQSVYGKHESRKTFSAKKKSSSSSSSRNSSPNSSLSNSSSNINNTDISTKEENNNKNTTLNNSKHNNSLNNLSSASATAYNQKLFVCSICDSKFHVVDHINEHFLKNHYNEYQRELSSKSPPRNTNVAQQNEEWNLSDPANPLKCIKCDFVGRWPTELQKHAASHSTSRPFKCLICSLTYKWRWDLAKHFDRTHPTFRNPYKKRDRDAARSTLVPNDSNSGGNVNGIKNGKLLGQQSNKKSNNSNRSRSRSIDSNYDDSNRSQSPSSDLGSESSFKNNQDNLIDFSNKPNIKSKLSNNNNNLNKSLPKLSKNINESTGLNSLQFDQFNPLVVSSLLANNNTNINSNNALWTACLASLTNQSMLPSAVMPPPSTSIFQQFQKNSNGLSSQEAFLNAMNMDPNAASLMLHSLLSQQQGLSNSNNQKNVNILSPLSNSSSSSQLNNNHNNTFLIKKLNNSIQSSCSISSVAPQQQLANKKIKTNDTNNMNSNNINNSLDKESRNFSCYWCDFKGRWRSEIIQHMRCHHAREKPYRCSACIYASNWKWDVQKHTKKQHPNNINAKIVEIPDQILFPDIKDFSFFESTPNSTQTASSTSKSTSPSSSTVSSYSSSTAKSVSSLTPPASNQSITSSTVLNKLKPNNGPINKNVKSSLCCQQCPYVACNLSDLRRHLIVHSNEQPYHCCTCDFKSKWKSDVKKHQRSIGHVGPILVGKKAMQKVIENLGLDRTSIVNLYGPNIQVIDNKQCKSNEKLIDEDNLEFKTNQHIVSIKKRKRCDSSDNNNDYDDQEEFIEDDEEEDEYEQLNEEDDDEVEIDEDEDEDDPNFQGNNNQEDDEMINTNDDEENNLNMMDDEDCNNLEIENDDEEL